LRTDQVVKIFKLGLLIFEVKPSLETKNLNIQRSLKLFYIVSIVLFSSLIFLKVILQIMEIDIDDLNQVLNNMV